MSDFIDRINREVKKAIEGELRPYPGSSFYFYRDSTVQEVTSGRYWITCYIHLSGIPRKSRIYLEEGIKASVNDALYYIQDGLYVNNFYFQYS